MNEAAIRFAGAALGPMVLGPLAPLSGPLTEAAARMFGGQKPTQRGGTGVAEAADSARIGTVTSVLNGRPFKVYAGKDFGEQNYNTYLALRAKDPSRFPEVKAMPQAPAAPNLPPPESTPDTTAGNGGLDWGDSAGETIPGAPGDVSAGGFGAEVRRTESDPEIKILTDLILKTQTPEYLRERTNEAIRQFTATTALTEALGASKSEQRFKRETALERMKQWTDLQKTAYTSNVLSQALLGQALIASQQPSAVAADIYSKGAQTAATALGSIKLS